MGIVMRLSCGPDFAERPRQGGAAKPRSSCERIDHRRRQLEHGPRAQRRAIRARSRHLEPTVPWRHPCSCGGYRSLDSHGCRATVAGRPSEALAEVGGHRGPIVCQGSPRRGGAPVSGKREKGGITMLQHRTRHRLIPAALVIAVGLVFVTPRDAAAQVSIGFGIVIGGNQRPDGQLPPPGHQSSGLPY